MGSLLYLSMTRNDKNINDKFFKMSRNLSSSMAKNILNNVLYKVKFEGKNKERINKILSYRNLRYSKLVKINNQMDQNNLLDLLPEVEQTNSNINTNSNKTQKQSNNHLNSLFSRNINSNLQNFQAMTIPSHKDTIENNSLKTFSPFSTFTNFNQKSYSRFFSKHSKNLQKDLNRHMVNLDDQAKSCNNKLIRLINGNRKVNLRRKEEKNREIVNLKKIIYDKVKIKPKKKINNILQIKSLINKAKLDFEGEVTIEKVRKNELKNFGHYINIMSDDLILSKVNELYSDFELRKEGKNFSQDELAKIKKKRKKELIVIHNRQKLKDNYIKMLKLENDLTNIKNKFNKTNLKVLQNSKNKTLNILLSKKI